MGQGPAPPIFGPGMSRGFGVDINGKKSIFGHLFQLQTYPWPQNRMPQVNGDGMEPCTADFRS
jgi:hypothetical protein